MATFVKYQSAIANMMNGVFNFGSDTLKFALTNTAPNVSTHTVLADITEIGAGNGYTAGGSSVAITSSTQSAGTYSLVPTSDVTITASGGAIGPFRYVVFYDDTPISPADPLVSYYDYGSSISLNDGESLTINVGATLFTAS